MQKLIVWALAALISAPVFAQYPPPIPPSITPLATSTIPQGVSLRRNLSNPFQLSYGPDNQVYKIVGNWSWAEQGTNTSGTDCSETGRNTQKTASPITSAILVYANENLPNNEGVGANNVFMRSSIEYPVGTQVTQAKIAGNSTWMASPEPGFFLSDRIGLVIPAATQFYVRHFQAVACAPTSPAAVLISGGSLSTSSTYYYKMTTIINGVESGPSAETTGLTPTTGNQSSSLTWAANICPVNTTCQIGVYRGTATGAEKYLTTVPGNQAGYVDTGSIAISTISPPAVQRYYEQHNLRTGESTNRQAVGGNGADATGTTGALSFTTLAQVGIVGPYAMLGDDVTSNPGIINGDSIGGSTGMGTVGAVSSSAGPSINGWVQSGARAAGVSVLNVSIPSTNLNALINGGENASARLGLLPYADWMVNELGHNDLAGTTTWLQIASWKLLFAQFNYQNGRRHYETTIPPLLSSTTNNVLTIGGQTIGTHESDRQNLNLWMRNGFQTTSANCVGTPVTSGGYPCPWVTALFDFASLVEVNSSNVLSLTGGFWQVPTSSIASYTLNGVPTATSLPVTATLTSHALAGQVILMTSGTQSGNSCIVSDNTTSVITCYAAGATTLTGAAVQGLSGAPTAGDTGATYLTTSVEGVHGTATSYATIGTAFATFLTNNVVNHPW